MKEQMDKLKEEAYAKIHLSQEVRTFMESKVGQEINKKGIEYRQKMLEQLEKVDPDDKIKIVELQAKALIPFLLKQWLGSALMAGKAIKTQLEVQNESRG